MAAEYYLLIKTPAGAKAAVISDYHNLAYVKKVNEPGVLHFELDANHPAIPLLDLDGQIEVWRRNPFYGIDWYCDFYALYRPNAKNTTTDHDIFTADCPGQMHWLTRRYVMWIAGTSNRSIFNALPAESIMKLLTSYNVTTNATTANGRVRNGTITGISNQADSGAGNILSSWSSAWKNLLSELQDLAKAGELDFDLIKTGDQTWEFRTYPGQRGTDRTATIVFSLDFGNMRDPDYQRNRIDEKTVAVVAGQGDGDERSLAVVTGVDFSATNDIETFVDARDLSITSSLVARGQAKLDEVRARNQFSFRVIQTAATAYGRDYFLGDLVRARYRDIVKDVKVQTVSISYERDGAEHVDIEMVDPQEV